MPKKYFNYFKYIENKYKSKLSENRIIIIKLDGKDITKKHDINIFNEEKKGFAYALKLTAKSLSKLYTCTTIATSDEIDLIIQNPNMLKKEVKKIDTQKIASLIGEIACRLFNQEYQGEYVYFAVASFNIDKEKLGSYLEYRKQQIYNMSINYIAKEHLAFKERKNKKCKEIEQQLKALPDMKNRTNYMKKGIIYIDGREAEITEKNDIVLKQMIESEVIEISEDDDI